MQNIAKQSEAFAAILDGPESNATAAALRCFTMADDSDEHGTSTQKQVCTSFLLRLDLSTRTKAVTPTILESMIHACSTSKQQPRTVYSLFCLLVAGGPPAQVVGNCRRTHNYLQMRKCTDGTDGWECQMQDGRRVTFDTQSGESQHLSKAAKHNPMLDDRVATE